MPEFNRISAELSDQDLAELRALVATARSKLPFLRGLTTQERKVITDGLAHDAPANAEALGLRTARMMAHITYLSEDAFSEKFGRTPHPERDKPGFGIDFAVESYLDHQGKVFIERFDALSYLYLSRVMDYFDPFSRPNATDAVTAEPVNFLVMSFDTDWRFSAEHSRRIVKHLEHARQPVSFRDVTTPASCRVRPIGASEVDSVRITVSGSRSSTQLTLEVAHTWDAPRSSTSRTSSDSSGSSSNTSCARRNSAATARDAVPVYGLAPPAAPDPTVYSVLADSQGRLYVCTNNGVQLLTPRTNGGICGNGVIGASSRISRTAPCPWYNCTVRT